MKRKKTKYDGLVSLGTLYNKLFEKATYSSSPICLSKRALKELRNGDELVRIVDNNKGFALVFKEIK